MTSRCRTKDFEYAILRNLTYGAENSWAVYYPISYLKGAEEILASDTSILKMTNDLRELKRQMINLDSEFEETLCLVPANVAITSGSRCALISQHSMIPCGR